MGLLFAKSKSGATLKRPLLWVSPNIRMLGDRLVWNMNKPICVALLAVGIMLIVFGINASDSLGSSVSRFFTGSPTDKAVWLLIGGAATSIIGLFGLGMSWRKT